MKKVIFTFVVCLCFASMLKSQDTILMRNGDEIQAKILEITSNELKYKMFNNPDGPTIVVLKNDVFMVKYQNHTKQLFEKQKEGSTDKQQNYLKQPQHIMDAMTYKNGLAINAEALLIKDFKLTYTHRLDKKLYFETMASYNIPQYYFPFDTFAGSGTARDPYYEYGRLQMRVGLKEYLKGNFYMGEMFLYSYGQFNNGQIGGVTEDYLNAIVNRVKHDYEILFKIGETYQHKKGFLLDLYMGIGWRWKYLDDTVNGISEAEDDPAFYGIFQGVQGSPYHQLSNYSMFEVHGGLQIGFGK